MSYYQGVFILLLQIEKQSRSSICRHYILKSQENAPIFQLSFFATNWKLNGWNIHGLDTYRCGKKSSTNARYTCMYNQLLPISSLWWKLLWWFKFKQPPQIGDFTLWNESKVTGETGYNHIHIYSLTTDNDQAQWSSLGQLWYLANNILVVKRWS